MGVSTKTASAATNSGIATGAGWTNTGGSDLPNALSDSNDDSSYGKSTPDVQGGVGSGSSRYLDATNFFSSSDIPAGSTNIYLRARLRRKRTSGSAGRTVKDLVVQLLVGGSAAGSNLADTATDWATTYADVWYGSSSSDAWGAGVTQAQAVASNFGLRVQVLGNSDSDLGHTPPEARITILEIEATFTDPVGMRRRATAVIVV